MENRKAIDSPISFADASLISFNFEEKNQSLNLFLEGWNERTIKIDFESVLCFLYSPGDFISNIYEIKDSVLVKDALIKEYRSFCGENTYRLIVVEDINDISIVQIVCKSFTISES